MGASVSVDKTESNDQPPATETRVSLVHEKATEKFVINLLTNTKEMDALFDTISAKQFVFNPKTISLDALIKYYGETAHPPCGRNMPAQNAKCVKHINSTPPRCSKPSTVQATPTC